MSASIIPPLPDPPSPLPLHFFRLTSISFSFLSPLTGRGGEASSRFSATGGWFQPPFSPFLTLSYNVSPSLSRFSPSFSLGHPLVRLSKAFSPRSPRGTPLGYFQAICFVNARNLDQSPSPFFFFFFFSFARFSPPPSSPPRLILSLRVR